jgi:hypothetical protein
MSTGPLVRIYSVVGQLRPDGAVELKSLLFRIGNRSDTMPVCSRPKKQAIDYT